MGIGRQPAAVLCLSLTVVIWAFVTSAHAQSDSAPTSDTQPEERQQILEEQINSLAAKSAYLQERFDYEGALRLCEEILELKKNRFGEDDWRVADAKLHIADVTEEARIANSNRIGLMELRRLQGYAKDAHLKKQYDRLLGIACMQVAKADELFGKRHSAVLQARKWQLDALVKLGRAEEALPVLREMLKLTDHFLSKYDPRRIDTLGTLAEVERAFGSKTEAHALLREAHDLLEQPDRLELMSNYQIRNEIAQDHYTIGEWDQAAMQWNEYVRDCEKRNTDSPDHRAIAFAQLTHVELSRGRIAEAYSYSHEAIRLSDSKGSPIANAAALGGSIAVYSAIADSEKAEAAIEQLDTVVRECKSALDAVHCEQALCKADLHWISRREFHKALATYRRASELPTPYFTLPCLQGTAWTLTETGELANAEELLKEADVKGFNETASGRSDHELNSLILANLRLRQGLKDDAIQLVSKDLAAAYQLFGEDNPILLPYVQLRVDVLRGCGKESEAKALEGKVVRLKERQAAARKQIDELARSRR